MPDGACQPAEVGEGAADTIRGGAAESRSQCRKRAASRAPLEGILSGETGQSLTMYDHYVARLADIFDIVALAPFARTCCHDSPKRKQSGLWLEGPVDTD